jgi:hypothetical protein
MLHAGVAGLTCGRLLSRTLLCLVSHLVDVPAFASDVAAWEHDTAEAVWKAAAGLTGRGCYSSCHAVMSLFHVLNLVEVLCKQCGCC